MWRRPPPSPLFQTRYPAPALVLPPPSRFSSSSKREMKSQTNIQYFCNYPDSFFQWSSLEPEALLSLSSVLLTNCSILQVHVQNFPRTSIKNYQQLDLRPRSSILSSPMPSLNVEGTVGQVGLKMVNLATARMMQKKNYPILLTITKSMASFSYF